MRQCRVWFAFLVTTGEVLSWHSDTVSLSAFLALLNTTPDARSLLMSADRSALQCIQSDACHVCCRPFLNLLGDESNAVRVEVMASLVQTLDQFCISNEEARTRAFADFLPALLAADAGCGYCWRIHHHLMLALPHFVTMFSSDEVRLFILQVSLPLYRFLNPCCSAIAIWRPLAAAVWATCFVSLLCSST